MGTGTQMQPYMTATGGDVDLNEVPAAAWNVGGPIAMVAGIYWGLARGWLYTGASHREIVADRDKRLEVQLKTIDSLTDSVAKYAVAAETTAHAMHEIEKQAARKDTQS